VQTCLEKVSTLILNDKSHGNARLISKEIKTDDIESSTWRISLHNCRLLAVDTAPSVRPMAAAILNAIFAAKMADSHV
jgi:hypothetical protein